MNRRKTTNAAQSSPKAGPNKPKTVAKTRVRGPGRQKTAAASQPKRAPRPASRKAAKTPSLGATNSSGGVPKSGGFKGLKMPKEKGPDQIQKRLKKCSPWYTSIEDPLHGADCKIPDETGVETGTMQCVQKVTVTAGAGGMIGLCLNHPYPTQDLVEGPQPNYWLLNGTTSTSTALSWSTSGSILSTTQMLCDFAQSTRIVSAAVYVQSEASLATNQGVYSTYAAGFVQASDEEDFPRNGDVLPYIQNHYKSAMIPVNNNRPAMVRWYPFARDELTFKNFISTETPMGDPVDPEWILMIVGSGLATGSVHLFTIVINYEFIPQANAANILDVTPSPKDATETDLVETWVQDMDVGTMTTTKNVSSSPSSVSPSHDDDPTGFGMFASVVSEILPFALALL